MHTTPMSADQVQFVGDLVCEHYDALPHGADVTQLRLALRALAHHGHVGARVRCDSVAWVHEGDGWVSDREAKSV